MRTEREQREWNRSIGNRFCDGADAIGLGDEAIGVCCSADTNDQQLLDAGEDALDTFYLSIESILDNDLNDLGEEVCRQLRAIL